MSGPSFGLCPATRDWLKETSGNPLTGHDWVRAPPSAPRQLDDTDDVMRNLAYKKIDAFSGIGHGVSCSREQSVSLTEVIFSMPTLVLFLEFSHGFVSASVVVHGGVRTWLAPSWYFIQQSSR